MANTYAGGVYIVVATKNGATEYWAAATHRAKAVSAVKEMLPPGWDGTVTERRLTPDQVAELKLRANGVRKLKSLP
jgi:hypothetical protein